eukprot:COSAG01_NODE_2023_length_8616_cov_89.751673_5_plen_100_part_00
MQVFNNYCHGNDHPPRASHLGVSTGSARYNWRCYELPNQCARRLGSCLVDGRPHHIVYIHYSCQRVACGGRTTSAILAETSCFVMQDLRSICRVVRLRL